MFSLRCHETEIGLSVVCLSSQSARDLGTEVVGAHAHQGRVDQTAVGSSGHGVGSGHSVGEGGSVGQDLGISLGITLAVDSVSVDSGVGESDSLGDGIESLGDWVKTSAGSEGDSGDSSVCEVLGVSLGLTLAVVSGGAGDGDVGGVHAGSGLEADDGVGGVWVASVAQVLSGDSSQQRGSEGLKLLKTLFTTKIFEVFQLTKNFIVIDTALISKIQLITLVWALLAFIPKGSSYLLHDDKPSVELMCDATQPCPTRPGPTDRLLPCS